MTDRTILEQKVSVQVNTLKDTKTPRACPSPLSHYLCTLDIHDVHLDYRREVVPKKLKVHSLKLLVKVG